MFDLKEENMKLMQQIEYLQADMDMISHDKNEQAQKEISSKQRKLDELTNLYKQIKDENKKLIKELQLSNETIDLKSKLVTKYESKLKKQNQDFDKLCNDMGKQKDIDSKKILDLSNDIKEHNNARIQLEKRLKEVSPDLKIIEQLKQENKDLQAKLMI